VAGDRPSTSATWAVVKRRFIRRSGAPEAAAEAATRTTPRPATRTGHPEGVEGDVRLVPTLRRLAQLIMLAETQPSMALLGEVRLLEDRLGLNPMSRLRLRWDVPPRVEQPNPFGSCSIVDATARFRRFAD
jgi:hypothetical protein